MPLKTFDFGPGERPAIFCDACGQEITDVQNGNAHWDEGPFFFSHKLCCNAVDRKFKTPCCQGLDEFLYLLTRNLKFDPKAVPPKAIFHVADHGKKKPRKPKGN
jgi:hypothetical protein